MGNKLKDYPEVSLKAEDFGEKIDFCRIFGRSGPVDIEIGCGKGAFLLNQAKARLGDNFLGIEWASRYYRFAVDRFGRWALGNVRLIRAEASAFLAEFVPDESVDCFHIYFPDPWPKKRHNKRRFICPANLEVMIRCLRPAGQIRIATDHADYFEQIKSLLSSESERLEQSEFTPAAGVRSGEWVGTNFERKYLSDNRQIYTIAVKKKPQLAQKSRNMTNYHLAILKKPYLDAILEGRKTIELRISKTRLYTSIQVSVGDIIFLKESSGPVCATATVSKVEYFSNIQTQEILRIKRLYNQDIGADEEFWQSKIDYKFGFLVWLKDVKPIEPVRINKKDWRAWVVLTKKQNFGLLDNK